MSVAEKHPSKPSDPVRSIVELVGFITGLQQLNTHNSNSSATAAVDANLALTAAALTQATHRKSISRVLFLSYDMPEELDVFLAAAAELDPSSSTQITSTLKKHFESPPTKHVALCLGLESLSDDEASWCKTTDRLAPNGSCSLAAERVLQFGYCAPAMDTGPTV